MVAQRRRRRNITDSSRGAGLSPSELQLTRSHSATLLPGPRPNLANVRETTPDSLPISLRPEETKSRGSAASCLTKWAGWPTQRGVRCVAFPVRIQTCLLGYLL